MPFRKRILTISVSATAKASASSWTVILPDSSNFSGRSIFGSASRRRFCSRAPDFCLLLTATGVEATVTGKDCPVRAAFCFGGRAMERLTWIAVAKPSSPSSRSSTSSISTIGLIRLPLTPALAALFESCPSSISSSCHFFPPLTGRGSAGRFNSSSCPSISAPPSASSSAFESVVAPADFERMPITGVAESFKRAGLGR